MVASGWQMAPEHDPRPLPSGARGGWTRVRLPLDLDEGALCFIKRCPPLWMHNHPAEGRLVVTHGNEAATFTWGEWEDYETRMAGMQRLIRRAHGVGAAVAATEG